MNSPISKSVTILEDLKDETIHVRVAGIDAPEVILNIL